jgi:hypothetical protein
MVAEPPPDKPADDKPADDSKPATDAKPAADTKPADDKLATERRADKSPSPSDQETQPPQPAKVKAATLREGLEQARAEAADWKGKYEKLAADTSKPKPDPEKEQLLKTRDDLNKQIAELQGEIKFANYERSQEYKEKYHEPFLRAYEQGQKLLSTLSYKEADKLDEVGNVTEQGKTRKGTDADWETLMSITDEDAANKFISEHFGYNAARVTLLRDKVFDIHNQGRAAIEEFRKQAGTRETQVRELMTKQQEEVSKRWHEANVHAAEKFPQHFAPDPADAKGTALLEEGIRLTDLAFGVLDPSEFPKLPEGIRAKLVNGKLPPGDMVMLHSAIRNRSAAYPRLVYKLKQAEAANKELTDKLAGFEKSEPGEGQRRRTETPGTKKTPADSWAAVDEAFDRLAAGNG